MFPILDVIALQCRNWVLLVGRGCPASEVHANAPGEVSLEGVWVREEVVQGGF